MTGTNTHGPCVGFTPLAPRMRCRAAAGSDPLAFAKDRYRIKGSRAAVLAKMRAFGYPPEAAEPGL